MLVVLEGLDGAGKSTQVKKLRQYLEEVFGSLEYIHFPRYDAPVYGELISRFLRGDFGSNEAVHPQLVGKGAVGGGHAIGNLADAQGTIIYLANFGAQLNAATHGPVAVTAYVNVASCWKIGIKFKFFAL